MTLNQKRIKKLPEIRKPVIVATELLQDDRESFRQDRSLRHHKCGSRRLRGDDVVGETAIGKFHIEAVRLMRQVSDNANLYDQDQMLPLVEFNVPQAIEDAIALIAGNYRLIRLLR